MNDANVKAVLTASLAGLLFGFDTAVIAGATGALRDIFALSPSALGFAVAAALIGTLVGALTMGAPGDRYGSRNMLRVIAVLYIVSAIGSALAWSYWSFWIFRFIGGLAIGGSSVLAPVYIAEISPARRRGLLVGLFQFNIVLGILVAFLSNFLIAQAMADGEAWRWKLGVAAAPSLLLFLLLFGIPQSPRWLLARGRRTEAVAGLKMFGDPAPEQTLAEIERHSAEAGRADARLSWRRHRTPILLALLIGIFNQLSGINAILYYVNDIFAAAGFSGWSSDLQAVAIGATNLVFTLGAMAVIDRVGRKPLLMIGSIGTAVALAGAAAIFATGENQWLLLWMLVGFIAFFAMSQGAVIWVYISEIFPTGVRARGQSIGSAAHWGMNALIAWTFPVLASHMQALPFWFFAGCMLVQLLVVWRMFPETKQVALEDMGRKVGA